MTDAREQRDKSIGQRLRSATQRGARPDAVDDVVADWSAAWRREQEEIIAELDDAIQRMDHRALVSCAGQLHGVTGRRFTGLDSVLRRLLSLRRPRDDVRSN